MGGTARTLRGAAAALLLLACGSQPDGGPVAVHWDRDTCERCAMTLGSRRFAAQVRLADRRPYLFDDIGCALAWIRENVDAPQRASLEIWAGDPTGTRWVDAREARFADGFETPMGYGWATAPPDAGQTIDLAELDRRLSARDHGRGRRGS